MPRELLTPFMHPRSTWRTVDRPVAVMALALAGSIVVGASFESNDTADWFWSSPGALVGAVGIGLVFGLILYAPLLWGVHWLDRRCAAAVPESGHGRAGSLVGIAEAMHRWGWPSFGVILVAWGVWFLVHLPGGVDSDTITQYFQWIGLAERTDHHPWFDTMVFGWFWDIGRALGDLRIGLVLFLGMQIVATAAGFGFMIAYLGRLGLSARALRVVTGLAAVFPPIVSVTSVMSKDSFAGVFWPPFLVLFTEILRTRGRVLRSRRAALATIGLLVLLVLTKRTNVYLLLVCALVLLVTVVRAARLKVVLGTVAVLVVTNGLWTAIMLPALGVQPANSTDMLSLPLQMTARTVAQNGATMPVSQRATIDKMLTWRGLAKAYTPRRADAVKGRWKSSASTHDKLSFASVWVRQGFRYPGTYLAAVANMTFPYFAPLIPVAFPNNLNLGHYVDFWLSRSHPGTTRAQITSATDQLRPYSWLAPITVAVNRQVSRFNQGVLLSQQAIFCSWLPLLALVQARRRRSWLLALAVVPLLVNLGFLVAGPIALSRYLIPMIYGSILVIGLLMVPLRWEGATPQERAWRRPTSGTANAAPGGAG